VLPLYAQVHAARQRFYMVTPFLLRWRSSFERVTAVFPLALYERGRSTRRFISPLVYTYANAETQERRITVPPLLFQRSSPNKDVSVLAPIWWRFHWKDEGKRLGIVFPLGLRYRNPSESTLVVLNTAFTRSHDRAAQRWAFHFFPLLSLSRFGPQHFKWQVLTGLLGREHDQARSRWRALWIWTDPS